MGDYSKVYSNQHLFYQVTKSVSIEKILTLSYICDFVFTVTFIFILNKLFCLEEYIYKLSTTEFRQ